jgi:hypothetical protein
MFDDMSMIYWSFSMAGLSNDQIILLVIILIVAVITFYAELRIRKIGVGKKYAASKINKDQAFNALHTTRAVRTKLRTEQVDTIKADYMIQRAESALNSNDYDSCIDLCQRAKEELIKNKREGYMTAEPESSGDDETITPPAAGTSAKVSMRRIIKAPEKSFDDARLSGRTTTNSLDMRIQAPEKSFDTLQLQAKFELRAAQGDIDTYSGDSNIRQKASRFIDESQRHMDAGEYQKSLSDSFKARKLLSGEPLAERLGETREPMVAEEGAEKELDMIETPVEDDRKPSSPIAGECKKCGTEYDADDVFCHSCGRPLKTMKCPGCGAELKGMEKFCRKCGKRVDS